MFCMYVCMSPCFGIAFLVLTSPLTKALVQWKVDFPQRLASGRAIVLTARLWHVLYESVLTSFLSKCGPMHAHQHPSSAHLLCLSSSLADGNENLCPAELREREGVCALVCAVEQTAIRQEPRPSTSTPAITSTGLFLPVGWFLPLRSLHFLHTHISLQQQYLFLNWAQVLWTLWTNNNSSSISLSLSVSFLSCCICLSLAFSFFLSYQSILWPVLLF